MPFELGLDTFGDRTLDASGALVSHAQALRDLVAQGEEADRVGLHFLGVGEHHRQDFAVSAPEVVLAAIAARTTKLRLGTAVTVLSTDDPIRVFQRFSTLDAISNGRAEVILGRGSFTESYPLFGFDLSDYDRLFDEKLDLYAKARSGAPVTWRGTTRPPLRDQVIVPPIERGLLPTWVGVGGTPASVVRAAKYGFPLMLAIIGGEPARFRPFVDLYGRALREHGHAGPPRIGVHAPGHVGETDAQAREALWPHFYEQRARIGGERGWPPPTRVQFEREADQGALFVGSAETVAGRIVAVAKQLGLSRFDLKYANGTMPHAQLMDSIARIGEQVLPRVQAALA